MEVSEHGGDVCVSEVINKKADGQTNPEGQSGVQGTPHRE